MTTFIPKGSMCKACINKNRICSHLKFEKMEVSMKKCGYSVVVCTDFKKRK